MANFTGPCSTAVLTSSLPKKQKKTVLLLLSVSNWKYLLLSKRSKRWRVNSSTRKIPWEIFSLLARNTTESFFLFLPSIVPYISRSHLLDSLILEVIFQLILEIVFVPTTYFSSVVGFLFLSPTASALLQSSLDYSGIWIYSPAIFW